MSGFPQQDKWQPRGFVFPFLSSLGVIISRSVPVAADGVISSPSTERRDFRPVVTEAFKPRRGDILGAPWPESAGGSRTLKAEKVGLPRARAGQPGLGGLRASEGFQTTTSFLP